MDFISLYSINQTGYKWKGRNLFEVWELLFVSVQRVTCNVIFISKLLFT